MGSYNSNGEAATVLAGILIGALVIAALAFDRLPAGKVGWWAARGALLFFMVFGWTLWVVIEMSLIDEDLPLSLPGLG